MDSQSEKEAFLKKILFNKGIIIKICNSYCKNKADREDLAQEITYQLWKSESRFNEDYSFTTWMYRIALNVAISFYRKGKITQSTFSNLDNESEMIYIPDDTDELEEKITLLQQFISELKELDKALMILYLESKTYAEIAEIVGVTETNTATRISRIKEKLKKSFSSINK